MATLAHLHGSDEKIKKLGTPIPTAWLMTSFSFSFFFFFLFCLFRAAPAADGSSRARGQTGAAAASLHHNQSNAGSEPHLRPIP